MQHSLVRRPLGNKGMNVKILADSKSHLEDVSVYFKTRTKCFPRSPNPILASPAHAHGPRLPRILVQPKGLYDQNEHAAEPRLLCSPHPRATTHQPPPQPRFKWVLEVIVTPSTCILEVRLFLINIYVQPPIPQGPSKAITVCYRFSRET